MYYTMPPTFIVFAKLPILTIYIKIFLINVNYIIEAAQVVVRNRLLGNKL